MRLVAGCDLALNAQIRRRDLVQLVLIAIHSHFGTNGTNLNPVLEKDRQHGR